MFDLYTTLKFVHVIAAMLWLGAAVFTFLSVRPGGDRAISFMRATAPVAARLYPAAAVVILGTGIWMTVDSWSFGDAWIIIGIVLLLATAGVGGAVLGRSHAAVAEAAEAGDMAATAKPLRQYLMVGPWDMLVLFTVVFVMIYKPGA